MEEVFIRVIVWVFSTIGTITLVAIFNWFPLVWWALLLVAFVWLLIVLVPATALDEIIDAITDF